MGAQDRVGTAGLRRCQPSAHHGLASLTLLLGKMASQGQMAFAFPGRMHSLYYLMAFCPESVYISIFPFFLLEDLTISSVSHIAELQNTDKLCLCGSGLLPHGIP